MREIGIFTHMACLLLLAGGCASVTRGTHEALEVTTSPVQATVELYRIDRGLTDKALKRNLPKAEYQRIKEENAGKPSSERFKGPLTARTPASFSLARNGEYRLEISKKGHEPATLEIRNAVAGGGAAGMAGNVLIGGIIGAGIDAGTGAMLKLVPNPVDIQLEVAEETAGEEVGTQAIQEETPEPAGGG